mmetsp:Transcript_13893/g.23936  ORF Transcript_13893/g.23936 Transcript_13893/m.23936 type:complete len:103 (+) Transcript_13893:116-424(+)
MSKKESILDLKKYTDKQIHVKFAGGREVIGTLRGFDSLVNLVLDDCKEYLRDPNDPTQVLDDFRELGLVVCRGTAVMTVSPPGDVIDNPFADQDQDEQEVDK